MYPIGISRGFLEFCLNMCIEFEEVSLPCRSWKAVAFIPRFLVNYRSVDFPIFVPHLDSDYRVKGIDGGAYFLWIIFDNVDEGSDGDETMR